MILEDNSMDDNAEIIWEMFLTCVLGHLTQYTHTLRHMCTHAHGHEHSAIVSWFTKFQVLDPVEGVHGR